MQNFSNTEGFLRRLNELIIIRNNGNDVPCYIKKSDDNEHPSPSDKPRRLVWNIEADLVIEGPCGHQPISHEDNPRSYPMGKCLRREGDAPDIPPRSWLHTVLADNAGARRIVVFAACCEEYSEWYTSLIRQLFSHIEWTFVRVPDLCDHSHNHPDRVAAALVRAGVLRVE